jgi:hypothetical protein
MDGQFSEHRFKSEGRAGKWNNYAETSFHLVLTNLVVRYLRATAKMPYSTSTAANR